MQDPLLAQDPLRKLVVFDEIQRRPDLLPVLRVLMDRRLLPAQFLLLGSASPELMRGASESMAGRVEFVDRDQVHQRAIGDVFDACGPG